MVLFELVGAGVFASASSLLFVVEIESSHLCGSWLLRVGDVLDQISEICESDRSFFSEGVVVIGIWEFWILSIGCNL